MFEPGTRIRVIDYENKTDFVVGKLGTIQWESQELWEGFDEPCWIVRVDGLDVLVDLFESEMEEVNE